MPLNPIDGFGRRLKDERKRLGLSQAEMASECGVQKLAQLSYEAGRRQPKSGYLERAMRLGVDLLYVISGTSGEQRQMKASVSLLTSIHIAVRYRCGTYMAAIQGVRASCTEGAERCALRLAEKLWGRGGHVAECEFSGPDDGRWVIIKGEADHAA